MKNLLEKLNEVVVHAITVSEKLAKEKILNDGERQENKSKAIDLNTRAKAIIELENKWRAIQKIVNFEAKVKKLQEETRIYAKDLRAERADFERERNMLRAEVEDIKALYKEKNDILNQERTQFARDKKNYKEEIQKTVDKQLREKGVRL